MKDKSKEILLRSFTNASQSVVEDNIKETIEQRSYAGLKNKIIRISSGYCCKWCDNLVGEYDADNAPADIYRRHDNCTCAVIFRSEKGYQDVHNKDYLKDREVRVLNNAIDNDYFIKKKNKRISYNATPESSLMKISDLRELIEANEKILLNPKLEYPQWDTLTDKEKKIFIKRLKYRISNMNDSLKARIKVLERGK